MRYSATYWASSTALNLMVFCFLNAGEACKLCLAGIVHGDEENAVVRS